MEAECSIPRNFYLRQRWMQFFAKSCSNLKYPMWVREKILKKIHRVNIIHLRVRIKLINSNVASFRVTVVYSDRVSLS